MVNQKEEICTDIGKAMGTFLRITSYGRPQGEVSKAVRAYFRNVENLCSRFRSDSDVSRISAAAGGKTRDGFFSLQGCLPLFFA